MNEQKHIIMRETLEITVPDRTRAMPIQNKISEIVKYRLNPSLDKLFSEISSPEEIVRIDKLEIDLGTISLDNFEEKALSGILKRTEEQLVGLIYKQRKKVEEKRLEEIVDRKDVSLISQNQDYLQIFIYFLQTGQIPWWNKKDNQNYLNDVFGEVLKLDSSKLKSSILPLLKRSDVRKRMVFQLNERQIQEILLKISETEFLEFEILFKQIVDLLKVLGIHRQKIQKIFLEHVLTLISERKKIKTENEKIDFIQNLLKIYFIQESSEFREKVITQVLIKLKNRVKNRISADVKQFVYAILYILFKMPESIQKVLTHPELVDFFSRPVLKSKLAELKKQSITTIKAVIKGTGEPGIRTVKSEFSEVHFEKTKPESKEKKDVEREITLLKIADVDEIFISNAGLVILHPFLKFFFNGLGLLSGELQFTNEQNAYRAVHLLQYLVTGKTENPEFELSLNKILCGLDVTEPIPVVAEISESDKEECNALLEAVLEQWKALKTKKTDALTDVFLKREGVLSFQNQGWKIKVERNTFDVMLDRLPWPISVIKLPWNPYFIYVEW